MAGEELWLGDAGGQHTCICGWWWWWWTWWTWWCFEGSDHTSSAVAGGMAAGRQEGAAYRSCHGGKVPKASSILLEGCRAVQRAPGDRWSDVSVDMSIQGWHSPSQACVWCMHVSSCCAAAVHGGASSKVLGCGTVLQGRWQWWCKCVAAWPSSGTFGAARLHVRAIPSL